MALQKRMFVEIRSNLLSVFLGDWKTRNNALCLPKWQTPRVQKRLSATIGRV